MITHELTLLEGLQMEVTLTGMKNTIPLNAYRELMHNDDLQIMLETYLYFKIRISDYYGVHDERVYVGTIDSWLRVHMWLYVLAKYYYPKVEIYGCIPMFCHGDGTIEDYLMGYEKVKDGE